jgi:hypothetical protein
MTEQGIALPQGTLDFEHRWIIKKPRRSFMRVKKALTLALFCLVAAPLLEGQIATDDEIKFASQPYIPQETNRIFLCLRLSWRTRRPSRLLTVPRGLR